MADIDVERKGPNIWPWIIGLIVVALLIWLLAEMFGGDDDDVIDPVTTEEVVPVAPVAPPGEEAVADVPPVVSEYIDSCAGPEANVNLDHTYASDCLNRLSASIDALVQNPNMVGVDLQEELQDYRQRADQLVNSPTESDQHANWTREAFVSAANLLDEVQDARFPALSDQVDQLEDAAEAVQGDVPMTDQGPAIQGFFRQAGEALRLMATNTPETV